MTKRSNVLSLIFIAFLSLITIFTLTACGKKTEAPATTQAPGATTAVVTTTASKPEIRVSYDQNFVFDSESIEDISDAINVEIVTNGVSQKVDYTVKGYEVSDDGQFVDITIEAYGMQQTIRVPYLDLIDPIRSELKPLYDLLNEEGNKSLTASVSGNNGDEDLFSYNLIANFKASGEIEFAVVDSEDNVLAMLSNNKLTIGTLTMEFDMEAIVAFIEELMGESEVEEDYPALESDFDMEADEFDLTEIFTALSTALDTLDTMSGSPMLSALNIEIEGEKGSYTIKLNSKTLLMVLPMIINEEEMDIDLDEIIDTIDTLMDGALKSGEFELELSLSIKNTTVNLGLKGNNKVNESTFTLNATVTLSSNLVTLPSLSEEQAEPKDLEISIPMVFPGKEIDNTLIVVVHTSDMLSEFDGELAHATLIDNANEGILLDLVVNNYYAYLDMTGLNVKMKFDEEAETFTFYQAFEIDGEQVTFAEYIAYLTQHNNDVDMPEVDDDYNDDEEFEKNPLFENGYGAGTVNDEPLVFAIGVTEEEVRRQIYAYYYDENDNQVEYTNYTLPNFDGTKPFSGDLEIKFDDGYELSIELLIIDLDNVQLTKITTTLENLFIEIGTSISDIEEYYLYGTMTYTDGNVEWKRNDNGFTITQIYSESGVTVDLTTSTGLEEIGNYFIFASYEGFDDSYMFMCYVYDPKNPIAVGIDCYNSVVYVDETTTEDDIRDMVYVVVVYDNNGEEEIEDYEIVDGYSYGDEFITIKWHDFSDTILVETFGYNPTPYDNEFNPYELLAYIRFIEFDEEMDTTDMIMSVLSSISEIVEEHQEEFDALYSVELATGKINFTFNINNEDGNDLFSVINYFLGIPTENGFDDIDEEFIIEAIDNFKDSSMYGSFLLMAENMIGFSISNVIEDSMINLTFSIEDGLSLSFSLDNAESSYMTLGIGVKVVEVNADQVITEDMIGAAQSFDSLASFLASMLLGYLL